MIGRPLYVFGAGGHGRVVAEAAQATRHVHGFLDDDPRCWGREYQGLPVLGGLDALPLLEEDAEVALGVGENGLRSDLGRALLARGRRLAVVVHPTAVVAQGARMGEGTYVGPLAVLHTDAQVGAVIEPAAGEARAVMTGARLAPRGPRRRRARGRRRAYRNRRGGLARPHGRVLGHPRGRGRPHPRLARWCGGHRGAGALARRPREDGMTAPPPRIYLSPPHVGDEERRLVAEAFDSNWIAPLGPQVDAFENEFAAVVGARAAAALSSGTAALHLRAPSAGSGRRGLLLHLTFVIARTPSSTWAHPPSSIRTGPGTWILPCSPKRSATPPGGRRPGRDRSIFTARAPTSIHRRRQ
jgi:hypothetical protein